MNTSIQRALVACDNAMQDALYYARDEGGAAAKVNHHSLFSRHSPAIRMWGIYPRYVSQGFKSERLSGTYLYTRWSNAGVCPRTTAESYYINPGSLKVNAGFPLKPVLITEPSLMEGIPSRRIAIKRVSESVYKLTTTLSSAIWGGITPSFLRSRTSTASRLTPSPLGRDPPTT